VSTTAQQVRVVNDEPGSTREREFAGRVPFFVNDLVDDPKPVRCSVSRWTSDNQR
jgi:hypothetical protein